MEIKAGAIVRVAGYTIKHRPYGTRQTTLLPISWAEPARALVLGKSRRQTGTVTYDNSERDQNYLTDITSHAVWIVMILTAGDRYRRPIAVLPTQILPDEEIDDG